MAQSIFDSNSTFKSALRRTKFRIDEASKQKVEIFGKSWYDKHFTFGPVPHLLEDFETVLGKLHLTIAASTINGRSAEPLRMNQGFESIKQGMFTYAHAYKMDRDEIRKLKLMAKAAEESADVQAVEYISSKLFDQYKDAVMGVRERLDIIILYLLSHNGQFTWTADNDPSSPFIGQTVNFGIPSANLCSAGSGSEWTDAHKNDIDPVAEIDAIKKQYRFVPMHKILLDSALMNYILSLPKMKGYINSTLYPNMPLTEKTVNAWMAEKGLPTFEVVDKICAVQKGNQVVEYDPWQAGQMVFIPQEQIGTIETAFSDAELGIKSEGVDYQRYGRIETRRMTVGERENSEYAEITKASLTGAPSIETAQSIICFNTQA